MTGYGEATAQSRWAKIAVQIRTLNHRHLDIQTRIPREYLPLEEEIRKTIRQRIARGRIELFITRSPLKGQERRLELDETLLRQYLQGVNRAKKKFGLKGDVDLSLLGNIPELFQLRETEVKQEDEKGLVLRIVESALKHLERSREREGRQLSSDMAAQLKHLRRVCAGLEREAKQSAELRLREPAALKEAETSPETPRQITESPNSVLKGDTNEEVVRLKSHLEELGRLLEQRDPVGKQLDFLLQEIQRELNTIGSKVPHLPVVRLVLSGKEKVEQIREQAQNVE